MIIGYTSARIVSLQQHTSAALLALDAIRTDDPAATGAINALGGLRTALADNLLPALSSLQQRDPLGHPVRGTLAGFTADGYERWIESKRFTGTEWSDLPTFDLFMHVQFELTRQVEEHGLPDPDDPFWTDDFPGLVEEFEYRAATDADFALQLAQEAATNPLIGYIVAAGDFDTAVQVAVVHALVTMEPLGPTRDGYRAAPMLDLLTELALDPDGALDLLINDGSTEALYTWNADELNPVRIPEQLLADLAAAALTLPFTSNRRIDDAYVALGAFVDVADDTYLATGFSVETSRALSESVVGYLPFLLDSFCQDGPFFGKDFEDNRVVELGSHAEVKNFFGALLRDPASFDLLLATIPALSISAGGPHGHDIEDVHDYVDLLVAAAHDEQQEEDLQAQRERNRWTLSINVVAEILDLAFLAAGSKYDGARAALGPLEDGAMWLVNRIDADDAGIADIAGTSTLLLTVGLSAYLLTQATASREDEEEDEALDAARADLDAVQNLMERGASPEEVRAKILDLRESVERFAGLDEFDDLDEAASGGCAVTADGGVEH